MPTRADLSRSLSVLLADLAEIERLIETGVGDRAQVLVALRRRASADFVTRMITFDDVAPLLKSDDVARRRSMLRQQRAHGAELRSNWSAVAVAANPAEYRSAVQPLIAESRMIIHAALAAMANGSPQ